MRVCKWLELLAEINRVSVRSWLVPCGIYAYTSSRGDLCDYLRQLLVWTCRPISYRKVANLGTGLFSVFKPFIFRNAYLFVMFEVFTSVTMKNGVFRDVTPWGSCKNRRIGRTRIGEQGTTLAVTSNRRTLRRNTKYRYLYFFAACVGC
jgi:hypothetical protein